MDETKITGTWYIPISKPIKVKGNLYLNPLKGIINLIVFSLESIGTLNEFDTIYGKTTFGSKITLYKCNVFQETLHMGTKIIYETLITAKYVFDKVEFKIKEDILFHEVIFRFSNLDEWAFLKGFNFHTDKSQDFSLTYKFPKQISCKVDNETTLILNCHLNSPLGLIVDKEVKVIQKVYISVKHLRPQPFEKSINIIRTLMDFVSLCIQQPVYFIEMSGLNPKHYRIYKSTKEKIYDNIPIYTTDQTDENYKSVDPRMILLNLQEIEQNFELYIKNWFEKRELLKPVIDLYLNTLNYKEMSIELHFLNLVQALESYHRRTRKNYVIDYDKHKERVNSIIFSISKEYKDWLKEKLNFSNEPALIQRLEELAHDGNDYWVFFNGKKEIETFINNVKNTRNYLIHYDKKLESKALKGEDLEISCFYLRCMVEYYLLKEIGLPVEDIRKKTVSQTKRIKDFCDIKKIRRNKS